jgi:heterodisulfide reductase subunit A
MSVARTAPGAADEFSLPVNKAALVVRWRGGMTSALTLAEQGFQTYLIERASDLGGMARRIHYTVEGLDVQTYLNDLKKKTYRHQLIRVITDATITDVSGYVGNFVTKVKSKGRVQEISTGRIIATGTDEQANRVPVRAGSAGHDQLNRRKIRRRRAGAQRTEPGHDQCVIAAGGPQLPPRVCCSGAMKNALKLKSAKDMDIYVLFGT